MKTFAEMERACEMAFEEGGPFWHLYTDGTGMEDVFCDDEEFRLGMTMLAVCAIMYPSIGLITFELMNNHVHLIMQGERGDCLKFFEIYKRRLKRQFMKAGRVVDWDRFHAQILKIETLKALRNEIIYVNRNAYVANYKYTPFSYPWGGGWAYFNPVINMLPVKSADEIGSCRMRELTHYRDIANLCALKFIDDVPFIPSFCRINIGELMFQNARNYFHALTRNAEAFSQIASRLKDTVFLTDDEMFVLTARLAAEMFSAKLNMLTPDQRIQLGRKMHFDYNATNQQIRRVLRLDAAVLEEMFPNAPIR